MTTFWGKKKNPSPDVPSKKPAELFPEYFGNSSTKMEIEAAFRLAVDYKQRAYRSYAPIRENYLVAAILNDLLDSILAPDSNSGNVVDLTVEDDANANKALRNLQQYEIDIDALMEDIAEDVLLFGEIIPRLSYVKHQGGAGASPRIVARIDRGWDELNTVAFYIKPSEPAFFLTSGNMGTGIGTGSYAVLNNGMAAHFAPLAKSLERYHELSEVLAVRKYYDSSCPRPKVGRSVFRGAIDKIQSLNVLDVLPIAAELAEIGSERLMGVKVPDGKTPEDAFELCRKLDGIFNQQADGMPMDRGMNVTVEDVMNAAKWRTFPVFGDKGGLQPADFQRAPRQEKATYDKLVDARKSICAAIGVPYNFLYGDEKNKLESLRLFSRYVNKINKIQRGFGRALQHVAVSYLRNVHQISIAPTRVSVNFVNKLVNVEDLDKIEFSQATVAALRNIFDFVEHIADKGYPDKLSMPFKEFISKYLASSGLNLQDQPPFISANSLAGTLGLSKASSGGDATKSEQGDTSLDATDDGLEP
jgi:hypothetical protein